jgi:hypothetical protein
MTDNNKRIAPTLFNTQPIENISIPHKPTKPNNIPSITTPNLPKTSHTITHNTNKQIAATLYTPIRPPEPIINNTTILLSPTINTKDNTPQNTTLNKTLFIAATLNSPIKNLKIAPTLLYTSITLQDTPTIPPTFIDEPDNYWN